MEREDPVTLKETMAKAENVESTFWGSSYGGSRWPGWLYDNNSTWDKTYSLRMPGEART